MSTATVTRIGNSRGVVIPRSFGEDFLPVGTKVVLDKIDATTLVVRPQTPTALSRLSALDELEALAMATPRVPWSDDSREADRSLMEGRYA